VISTIFLSDLMFFVVGLCVVVDTAIRARFLVISTSLLWGSAFVAIKWGLNLGLDPLFFVIFRFVVAVIVALPLLKFFLRDEDFFESFSSTFLVLGFLNALAFVLQFYGMELTTASKSALLINLNVVFVAIISYKFLGESFGLKKILAVFVGIFGAVFITTEGELETVSSKTFLGDMMVLSAGIIWALFIILSKKWLNYSEENGSNQGGLITNLWVVIITGVFLFLLLPLTDTGAVLELGWKEVLVIFYLGGFCTVLAFGAWYVSLEEMEATVSVVYLLLSIVFAVFLAALFLDESITFFIATGGSLIGISILLVVLEDIEKSKEVLPKSV
jgi:drug/metabolite transporter (DMT)-like permease